MKSEQAFRHAAERFKDHVATYCDYGNVKTLTWAKPGRRDYSMRYVFDAEAHTMTITGDLGFAVVYPTCKVDLEHCAQAFQSVDYFSEKIRASSDLYVFDEEDAEAELRERLLSENMSDDQKSEVESMIEDIMEDYDYHTGVRMLDDNTSNRLNSIDSDAFEWIGSIGRQYHLRVFLWKYGLQMAYKQVSTKEQPELHVELGMSTTHISESSKAFLDECVDSYATDLVVFRKEDCAGNYGWWITCDDDPADTVPEDLRQCIQYAQKFGASWIMFDGDATVYDGLPTY